MEAAAMPTVLRVGPYRFFCYAGDCGEPPHVYVEAGGKAPAKFWLDPVRLSVAGGFSPRELREIERIIRANERMLLEAWNDFCK
jgi:Domain of unknown function (DUF4160)